MYKALDSVRRAVKAVMRGVAKGLNKLSGGKITPNFITYTGLIMHVPIAYLIAIDNLVPAAVLLAIFGLFDTLDGELARLQGKASTAGMFLDSVTDRIKEVMIYIGAVYLFVNSGQPGFAVWAVAACGLAVTVSYINAWGEVALAKHGGRGEHAQNKSFRSGLATYDVRIFLFIVGLAFGVLDYAVVAIALLSFVTVIQRASLVIKRLS